MLDLSAYKPIAAQETLRSFQIEKKREEKFSWFWVLVSSI